MARPTSDQDGDEEGAGPEQEEAMGTEPSADLALAILNGLDISSLSTVSSHLLSVHRSKYHSQHPVASGRDGAGHP